MNARNLNHTSRVAACLLAVAIAALQANGKQPVQIQPPTPTELRAILENQPDFTAEGISRDPKGIKEVNVGRVARRGSQYRIDPAPGTLDLEDESNFELLLPGTYGVMNFASDPEESTALIVQTKQRRYHELSVDDDDFMEAYALLVVHPHMLLLVSAVLDEKKPALEYLGEATVDGHPCVKFASDSDWGSGRTTYYAARDLRNLVVRIEWTMESTGSFMEFFPTTGDTILRNVKLEAAAELFAVPRGFAKVDRAATKSNEEADRQKRLHSADGAPSFSGVNVEPPIVRPGKSARVTVGFALASSEIELTFKWKPDAGRIVGTGRQVDFDATGLAEGEYGVTFEVTDNYGHAPYVGRVMLKVRAVEHDLSDVQTPFPSAGFVQVLCGISDRAGGWYVGGRLKEFTRGIKRNVVHLLANGTIDPDFAADTGLGEVTDLAFDGSVLYAAGYPSKGSGVVALNSKSGARLPWEPRIEGIVRTIELSHGTLYVGGILDSVGGETRPNLAAIDTLTAKVLPWKPAPDQEVSELLVADNRLFVVGSFYSIAGKRQSMMVAFDIPSGRILDFDVFMYPKPSSISVHGNVIYYVSSTEVGALDVRTGDRLPWHAQLDGSSWGLAATAETVYVAGSFTTVDGKTRPRIATIDAKTGAATSWDPEADSHLWVIIPSGGLVFAGGNFETIGRQRRSKFAVLDAETGDALPGAVK
jgi:hypothetical protein